jgi:hypothetical protein
VNITRKALEERITDRLAAREIGESQDIAWACAWLEACSYPGLRMLEEALQDARSNLVLQRDALGMDLDNVSCVFLGPAIAREVEAGGRVFLRNVRHGLFLLPFAVRNSVAIGCPIDPSFAVGGERTKNPYAERLAAVEAGGLTIAEETWKALSG